ncbi:SH3 domain-containing protein [Pseudanabaena sp. FACHB-2040]|uniref:SH3 domain-containing protein n=1 Tax=Pseudanabaena sp. FACHB-2040 TaxID=2692859 RepID=UPI00168338BF|nr:SH3 domain-containing protein [Pseudanabaena sp. FACHB-2040]MBD2259784.1 SH3 domain-containing protein [Pseudanabaena sp. FACHB-2040]
MKGFLTGLSKLVLGVVTALLLLSLAGVATARYFMARLAVLPPKPAFENDALPQPPQTQAGEAEAAAAPAEAAPTPDPPPTPELEEGAYEAVVVQPIGLVLREGPGTTFAQLGGIDNNDAVVVLEESPDNQWVKVRVTENGQEGWIKAGNIRKTE